MKEIWLVEHREMINENTVPTMDTVIMFVASTKEKAIEYVKVYLPEPEEKGWFVVAKEFVDTDPFSYNPEMYIYDLSGNELAEQPV